MVKKKKATLSVAVNANRDEPKNYIEDAEPTEELEAPPIGFVSESSSKVFAVQMILQMYRQGNFKLPSFQRKFVWSRKRQQGFLESLTLGVPMTSLMVAVDPATQERFIIDGFQRIRTMDLFMSDRQKMGPNIEALAKKKYSKLPRPIQQKLLNTDFVIIEVRAERHFWPFIFGQINKGGISLNPTEIRRATYQHEALLVLDDLTETNQLWQTLFGPNIRYRGLQAALRATAMHLNYNAYQKPINKFMNSFCADILGTIDGEDLKMKFELVIEGLYKALGGTAFRLTRGVNLGLIDCMLHAGLSLVEAKWDIEAEILGDILKQIRESLIKEYDYCFKGDTSRAESVMTRLKATDELVALAVKELKKEQ